VLIGTDSGCGSSAASVRSISQRSSIDSPMPMMPAEQTGDAARRTRFERGQRSSYVRVEMIDL